MICYICFVNVQRFDIFDFDHLINSFYIQLFDMLISQLKVVFSNVFMLLPQFWKLKSSIHVYFMIDFRF